MLPTVFLDEAFPIPSSLSGPYGQLTVPGFGILGAESLPIFLIRPVPEFPPLPAIRGDVKGLNEETPQEMWSLGPKLDKVPVKVSTGESLPSCASDTRSRDYTRAVTAA